MHVVNLNVNLIYVLPNRPCPSFPLTSGRIRSDNTFGEISPAFIDNQLVSIPKTASRSIGQFQLYKADQHLNQLLKTTLLVSWANCRRTTSFLGPRYRHPALGEADPRGFGCLSQEDQLV